MKHVLVLLLASFTLFSCSKEKSIETGAAVPGTPGGGVPGGGNPGGGTGGGNTGGGGTGGGSTYFIKAKVDGTERTYTTNAFAVSDNSGGMEVYSLTASGNGGESVTLILSFITGGPAVGTTYTEKGGLGAYLLAGMFVTNTTEMWAAGLNPSTVDQLSVTLTTKTATQIAGTFKGAFYKQNANGSTSTTEHKRLTEGEFNLPIQ